LDRRLTLPACRLAIARGPVKRFVSVSPNFIL
jgi:hypothetical protein